MEHIFISYNRKSEDITKRIVEDIQELGHTVWFDHEISGGQPWWDKILSSIRECEIFVFIVDPRSLNSTACQREYTYASKLGKSILPLLVSDEVHVNLLPPELSAIQFVDCITYDTKAVLRLARALGSLPRSKPLPDPLPGPPEIPVSYLGALGKRVETPESMSFDEQKSLLLDLKTSYLDPETTGDAKKLLEVLRKRPDLLATVAGEIDELLGRRIQQGPGIPGKESNTPRVTPTPKTPKPATEKKTGSKPLLQQLNVNKEGLENSMIGSWTAQAGAISASFNFNSNGSFSGQVFLPTGVATQVQGTWTVQVTMLSLRGNQTLMFVNYPYLLDIMVMTATQNRVEGFGGGELIVLTRN